MNKIKIKAEDVSAWTVPPECGGQIVEESYAHTEEMILKSTLDKADGSLSVVAYEWPDDYEWNPQNGRPALGAELGEVTFN